MLARNLLRRISMLRLAHGDGPLELDYGALLEKAANVETRRSDLRWWDLARYSNRQRTTMKMGGFVGRVVYGGEGLGEFLPLIAAGEILRIGSGTSLGLGKYRVEGEV